MNISDERNAATPKNSLPEQQSAAAAAERHTDWISYAVAVAQLPQSTTPTTR